MFNLNPSVLAMLFIPAMQGLGVKVSMLLSIDLFKVVWNALGSVNYEAIVTPISETLIPL